MNTPNHPDLDETVPPDDRSLPRSRVTDQELRLFIYGGLRDPEATARIVEELQDTQSSIRQRMRQIDPIKGNIDLSQWPIIPLKEVDPAA